MNIKENDKEFEEIEESDNILKLSINSNDTEKYLLKIFLSKKSESLIFKLEKEKIKTYYYYARLCFRDFKAINKIFASDTNINNVFIRLKEIFQNYECSLEKEQMKIKISFTKTNSKSTANFILRKKIVAQNRLNYQLLEEIQENKAKIKNLKRQIAKLDKTIENKNNIIDNINADISQILNTINDININSKNIDGNDLDNSKINNNKNISLKGEDFIEKKALNNNNNQEKIMKQNLSHLKDEKDSIKNIDNNKNRKNNNYNKSKKEEKIAPKSIKEFSFLCFGNINIYNYRKIYETLIIFNIVSILIIMYLLCYLYVLKSNLTIEKIKDFELMRQMNIINNNFGNNVMNEDIRGLRENIVDFQLKNDKNNEENSKNQQKKKKLIIIRKKKSGERKKISLLTEEKEKFFYKKHIGRRMHHRVRDINFELKYNSNEHDIYRNYTNDFENIDNDYKILILIVTNEGNKYGVFLNNSILYNKGAGNDNVEFSGYLYNNNRIEEIRLKEFYDKYGIFLQNIFDFIIDNKMNDISTNYNNETVIQSLGDIIIFEIYQVNVFKKHNQII
jgi:hypothetical protein